MSRVLFSEHQSFRQVVWLWLIVIPACFISVLSILYGFYQQIVIGEPWGNEPMNDTGIIVALVIVIAVNAFVIWLLVSIRLDIEITKDEFRYKYFSFTKWKVLTRNQITQYAVEKFTWWKARGLGYHVNLISKTERVVIKPNSILTLNTSGGKTLILGTENKEELERAMHKLMSTSENF